MTELRRIYPSPNALSIVLVEPGAGTYVKKLNYSAVLPRSDVTATFLLADDSDSDSDGESGEDGDESGDE